MKKDRYQEEWKRARVVLVTKPGKENNDTSSFRPKFAERHRKDLEFLLQNRIEKHVISIGDLSPNHHGFKKRMGIIDAVEKVIVVAKYMRSTSQTYLTGRWAETKRNEYQNDLWSSTRLVPGYDAEELGVR